MTAARADFYDVAVVGAGPAGSSAAIRLARAGLKVALLEQKQFPRQKLCGEFISPECLIHFEELGVLGDMSLAGSTDINRTVFYARNARSVTVLSEWLMPGSHALGLSRAEMDACLMAKASVEGADVFEQTQVTGLIVNDGVVRGVETKGTDRQPVSIEAKLTVDATGRAKVLARMIEKTTSVGPTRQKAQYVAFKTHLEGGSVPEGDCEIYAYRGGYGGCNRVEKDLSNLCFIVTADTAKQFRGDTTEILRNVVFDNAQAARTLREVVVVDDWLAVPIESYGRGSLTPAAGLITIGDAAAFIDPFTGSGILLALESSKIAAKAIASHIGGPNTSFGLMAAEYKSNYAAAFNRRLRICSMLRRAAFVPFLAELMINGLAVSETVTRRLAQSTRPN